MIFGWFGTVAHESEGGKYNKQVDVSFRWGMSWFIFSEVMFFARVLRRAVLHARAVGAGARRSRAQADLAGFQSRAGRPPARASRNTFTPMGAWGIPALNTLILLSSGVTVTFAHWGLLTNNRTQADLVADRDHRPGHHVPRLPGLRVRPCLLGAQPQAHDRRLRRDVLHADRLSRLSRDGRHASC